MAASETTLGRTALQKATGKHAQSTAASATVVSILTKPFVIDAESIALVAADPIAEAARLRTATGYGRAAGAAVFSDGTVIGAMPDKGTRHTRTRGG